MTREESIKRLDEQAFKELEGHKCKGEVMIDLQECVNKFIELEEKRKMQEMKEKEIIKEAAMIMHPKHKGVVMQAGLKNVVFSKACEEDKAYLVTDEGLAQAIRDYQDSLYLKESEKIGK